MTQPDDAARPATWALVLSGGAARGLAHIGVLAVLERERLRPDYIVGSSMGGLIGALSAVGLPAGEIASMARQFHFPRWFVPGGSVVWDQVFRSAVSTLEPLDFGDLQTPLVLTAVDLEGGHQVLLRHGALLPAVRATCAVPGVLPPIKIDRRWLIDGGLVNFLPVDVAWMFEPEAVIAVKPAAARSRPMPQLDWYLTKLLYMLGRGIPNPATAKISLEILVRAAEILFDRATALATAMAGPELLIEVDVGDLGLRDFHRIDDAVAAGKRATEDALPLLRKLLAAPGQRHGPQAAAALRFDPVCTMVVSPSRAKASAQHGSTTYYFCSTNCHDCFVQDPARYLARGR